MTFHDYLLSKLESTVMIKLTVGTDTFQYNYWNWFHQQSQFHLLRDDFAIGHILHNGSITENDDGSVSFNSNLHPKNLLLNFYFGQATP
jgi:hypothetical protein